MTPDTAPPAHPTSANATGDESVPAVESAGSTALPGVPHEVLSPATETAGGGNGHVGGNGHASALAFDQLTIAGDLRPASMDGAGLISCDVNLNAALSGQGKHQLQMLRDRHRSLNTTISLPGYLRYLARNPLAAATPQRRLQFAIAYAYHQQEEKGVIEVAGRRIPKFDFLERPLGGSKFKLIGQDAAVYDLFRTLGNQEGYVVVLGPNGCGKSHLMEGNVLPLYVDFCGTDYGAQFELGLVDPDNPAAGPKFCARHEDPLAALGQDLDILLALSLDRPFQDNRPPGDIRTVVNRHLGEILQTFSVLQASEVDRIATSDVDLFQIEPAGDLCGCCAGLLNKIMEATNGDYVQAFEKYMVARRFVPHAPSGSGVVTLDPKESAGGDSDGTVRLVSDDSGASSTGDNRFLAMSVLDGSHRGIAWANELANVIARSMGVFLDIMSVATEGKITEGLGRTRSIRSLIMLGSQPFVYKEHILPDRNRSTRSRPVFLPYCVRLQDEKEVVVKKWEEAAPAGKHANPYALSLLTWMSLLSRLENDPNIAMTDIALVRAFSGRRPVGVTLENVNEMRVSSNKLAAGKGNFVMAMEGIGPRDVGQILSHLKADEGITHLDPKSLLEELRERIDTGKLLPGLDTPNTLAHTDKDQLIAYLNLAKAEVDKEMLEAVNEAWCAQAEALELILIDYIRHCDAFLRKEKVHNAFTGEDEDPDETKLRPVEEALDIPEQDAKFLADRRGEIFRLVALPAGEPGTDLYKLVEKLKAAELKRRKDASDDPDRISADDISTLDVLLEPKSGFFQTIWNGGDDFERLRQGILGALTAQSEEYSTVALNFLFRWIVGRRTIEVDALTHTEERVTDKMIELFGFDPHSARWTLEYLAKLHDRDSSIVASSSSFERVMTPLGTYPRQT